tara:strand:+ start:56 stop:319 length:264 start_codon:yes stop_codon:yes gene_type:complete
MSYKYIINPVDNKSYSIYSELGRELLQSYINKSGGSKDVDQKDKKDNKSEEIVIDVERKDTVQNRVFFSLGGGNNSDYINNIFKFII